MTSKIISAGSGISRGFARLKRGDGLRHASRFGVIGVGCVLIDLLVYTSLAGTGLSAHAAKAASYLTGTVAGFFGNKFWTFGSRRRCASEPVSYLAVYALTLAVNVAVNAAVLSATGWTLFAFLVATGLTTVLNFLGLRWVTFREGVRQRQHGISE